MRKTDSFEIGNMQGGYYNDLFTKVCDETDWKAPICARVHRAFAEDVKKAIEFMTATSATAKPDGEYMIIESIGYRAGPAGP